MTYPLTEKQKEIVDYSDGHGLEEDEARFGICHNQVRYLREKRNRKLRSSSADHGLRQGRMRGEDGRGEDREHHDVDHVIRSC